MTIWLFSRSGKSSEQASNSDEGRGIPIDHSGQSAHRTAPLSQSPKDHNCPWQMFASGRTVSTSSGVVVVVGQRLGGGGRVEQISMRVACPYARAAYRQ